VPDAIRQPAFAGSWYPGSGPALAAALDRHLAAAEAEPDAPAFERLLALVVPHAGLVYSGAVAACAYRLLRDRRIQVAVLVGPSHHVAFEGVSIYQGGFDSPLGVAALDAPGAAAVRAATPLIRDYAAAHAREHSLEMQVPFLRRVAPEARIVPLVMGHQSADAARELGDALAAAFAGRRALLVASTDLSHYHDAATAARLDAVVLKHVAGFDAQGLQGALDECPDHACGGGPAVAVMRAAWALGARHAAILKYADSGDVSGDKSAVVGYLAAAMGNLDAGPR
jgi:AmmeMemoRadiSam system protein B